MLVTRTSFSNAMSFTLTAKSESYVVRDVNSQLGIAYFTKATY